MHRESTILNIRICLQVTNVYKYKKKKPAFNVYRKSFDDLNTNRRP